MVLQLMILLLLAHALLPRLPLNRLPTLLSMTVITRPFCYCRLSSCQEQRAGSCILAQYFSQCSIGQQVTGVTGLAAAGHKNQTSEAHLQENTQVCMKAGN